MWFEKISVCRILVGIVCCSVLFSKMYKKNPLKIVDEKKSQQSKFLLNIVDLQKLIEKKPTKILIYATIIVKQQKGNSNNSNHPMETRYTKNIFIITPMKETNKCCQPPSMGWVLGYPQTSSYCVESLSSIMCKLDKNMVCYNENNQCYTNISSMKTITKLSKYGHKTLFNKTRECSWSIS